MLIKEKNQYRTLISLSVFVNFCRFPLFLVNRAAIQMAPMKRQSNGRSPLVKPQRQITSFFNKNISPSPSPSPSLTLSKNSNKSKSNPNPSCERSPSPSPSPTTPSPFESKSKKPRLVIGQTPSPSTAAAANKSYGEEVVGKRIRVYWPLDKAWYEGCVKSFEKEDNKHLIQYEDGEEESLDLRKENIEWVQQSSVSGFKRLRRGSSLAFKKVVIEDDDAMEDEKSHDESDSGDEDWEKNADKEQMSEDEEVNLVDEQEEEEEVPKGKKRKAGGGGKKSRNGGVAVKGGFKVSVMEPLKNVESK